MGDFDATRPVDDEQVDASYLTDFERPSFGARIAARPSYPAIPKPAPPAADNAPAPPVTVQLDPSKMPDIMQGVSTKMPPPAPVGSNNPNLPGLLRQQAEYGKPIDRGAIDPATGKPKYHMGLGQRLLGIAANFGAGMGGRGPVEYIGPGATNHRYDVDEATRQANLENVGAQIKGQEHLDTENLKAEREATRQAYETGSIEARKAAADAQQSRADAYQQLADTREKLSGSQSDLNAARANQANATANQRDANRPRQIMGNRIMEKQDDGKWKDIGAAPTKQFAPKGGGKSTAKLPTARDFDKVEKDKNKALSDAEKDAEKNLKTALTEDDKQEIFTSLERKKGNIQAEYEARITNLNKTPTPASPAASARPTTSTPKAAPEVGKTISVEGKPFMVTGFNPKTKKPIGHYVQ